MKIIPKSSLTKISGGTVSCFSYDNAWNVSVDAGETFDFGILPFPNRLLFDSNSAYHQNPVTRPATITNINSQNAKSLGFSSFEMVIYEDTTYYTFSL